ncbi:unnamed protein product [marine sediment metagenome]|uniref:Uncharacterized protein n=1 Tax=marine sediment metagenome TaxID=412755 RepID=X1HQ53_9ZZZZ
MVRGKIRDCGDYQELLVDLEYRGRVCQPYRAEVSAESEKVNVFDEHNEIIVTFWYGDGAHEEAEG